MYRFFVLETRSLYEWKQRGLKSVLHFSNNIVWTHKLNYWMNNRLCSCHCYTIRMLTHLFVEFRVQHVDFRLLCFIFSIVFLFHCNWLAHCIVGLIFFLLIKIIITIAVFQCWIWTDIAWNRSNQINYFINWIKFRLSQIMRTLREENKRTEDTTKHCSSIDGDKNIDNKFFALLIRKREKNKINQCQTLK